MTTESVLEKLKRYADDLEDLNKIEGFGTERSEWEDVRAHHRCNFEIYTLPKIIAALELVEEETKRDFPKSWFGEDRAYYEGKTDLASELLAVVNGETKGE